MLEINNLGWTTHFLYFRLEIQLYSWELIKCSPAPAFLLQSTTSNQPCRSILRPQPFLLHSPTSNISAPIYHFQLVSAPIADSNLPAPIFYLLPPFFRHPSSSCLLKPGSSDLLYFILLSSTFLV